MKIIIKIKNQNKISVWIKNDDFNTEKECLTAGQGFDNVLISLLDKILLKHKIRRLSLKNIEIQEEIREMSASRLIAAAVREAVLTQK